MIALTNSIWRRQMATRGSGAQIFQFRMRTVDDLDAELDCILAELPPARHCR